MTKRYEYRTHSFWTVVEEETARALYEDGESVAMIAHKLGRTTESVRLKLHRLGIRVEAVQQTDYEATELCIILGITLAGLHHHMRSGLPSYLRGKKRFINRTEFRDWLMMGHALTIDVDRITDESMQRLAIECRGSWLVARKSVAVMFGVTSQTISYWIKHRLDFPRPKKLRRNQQVWLRDDLVEWAKSNGRKIYV
jgi:predicted DNA-binding transcriptional regulator AlpA